jgi:hypothetical protein
VGQRLLAAEVEDGLLAVALQALRGEAGDHLVLRAEPGILWTMARNSVSVLTILGDINRQNVGALCQRTMARK